ncbi:uncharacterized protein LOC119013835 isoform X2 [Acanthopagrus latus]|uniref:uncharacterized protein LOC119013835 isoform X2 n=1 Tax=Acanthopagrus latus TaxID=8177 RepID=UPI00187C5EFE|nr:uncharacterized protein LOC119013835 isoform X2 [Acanthopagrus latus]
MKKKKQRTKKTNKKNKECEKVSLDETCRAFRSSGPEFELFLVEMSRWFLDRQQQLDELFRHEDAGGSGSVHMKDFELGLMNLNDPCRHVQLYVLTQLLKTSNNTISYRDLSRRIQSLRFVRLRVRLIPFDFSATHPGNFEVVLLTSSRVFRLIRIIQDRVGIQTYRLEVFRSRVPREEARLTPESSLEECGFRGGPEETPPEDTVYYDYTLLFTDCPVLNCDHYFRSTSR